MGLVLVQNIKILNSTERNYISINENLVQLLEVYKNTPYYNQGSPEISLKWLENKLNSSELEELERQIYYVMLENEEILFINTLKFIWQTTKELSTLDT